MPNYKVVNSDQLDSDITTVADAIREKAGTSGKMAFPNGMADAVRNIQSGGTELPELDNPGTASDLAQGKQLIDENGNVVEGAVPVVEGEARYFAYDIWDSDSTEMDSPHASEHPGSVQIFGNIFEEMLLRKYSGMYAYVPKGVFGNAQPSDVRKGVTFTASGGVRAEGTMDAESGGGGLKIVRGTATVTNQNTIIQHNAGFDNYIWHAWAESLPTEGSSNNAVEYIYYSNFGNNLPKYLSPAVAIRYNPSNGTYTRSGGDASSFVADRNSAVVGGTYSPHTSVMWNWEVISLDGYS